MSRRAGQDVDGLRGIGHHPEAGYIVEAGVEAGSDGASEPASRSEGHFGADPHKDVVHDTIPAVEVGDVVIDAVPDSEAR